MQRTIDEATSLLALPSASSQELQANAALAARASEEASGQVASADAEKAAAILEMRREAPSWRRRRHQQGDGVVETADLARRAQERDGRNRHCKRKLSEVRAAEHPRRPNRAAAHRVGTRPLPPTGAAHAWQALTSSHGLAEATRHSQGVLVKMQRIYHEALAARDSVSPPPLPWPLPPTAPAPSSNGARAGRLLCAASGACRTLLAPTSPAPEWHRR